MGDNSQATVTPTDNGGQKTATPADNGGNPVNTPTDNKGADNSNPKPYMVFNSQEEFDRHSAGILNNAKNKAEKELLALLGLKPDEKDKLAKFKEAYDATLTEAEKKAKELENFKAESAALKASVAEKDAIIAAITKSTGKKPDDVMKFVRMAKGLVDENTTMEQALEQVFALSASKTETPKPTPQGTPPADNGQQPTDNPFKTGNLTEQGKLFKADPEKARRLYKEAKGKEAPF
jgi:hypothetical protein